MSCAGDFDPGFVRDDFSGLGRIAGLTAQPSTGHTLNAFHICGGGSAGRAGLGKSSPAFVLPKGSTRGSGIRPLLGLAPVYQRPDHWR